MGGGRKTTEQPSRRHRKEEACLSHCNVDRSFSLQLLNTYGLATELPGPLQDLIECRSLNGG